MARQLLQNWDKSLLLKEKFGIISMQVAKEVLGEIVTVLV
jgi:hypothetical protein